jgi:SAM-dependent methyltransferase
VSATAATRRYFERRAGAVDRFYEVPLTGNHALRRGPWHGRELAVALLTRNPGASVLDAGCGPGRVAEAVIEAGAGAYAGIDLSPHMLALARERLARFDDVELYEGDLVALDLPPADIVLALGLFDYLADPGRAAAWMRARCCGTLLASFTRWDWLKGPVRHFHYELLHRCPIRDYTEDVALALLRDAGFSHIDVVSRGRRGFFVEAAP